MAGTAGRSGGNRELSADRSAHDGLPEPPQGRTDAFYAKWASLLADLPASELRRIDGVQLAILVDQLIEIDQLGAMIEADPSDLKSRSLRLRVSQQVARLSAQFGLSPADRKRLNFDPPEVEDEFSIYMKRRNGRFDEVDEWEQS